MARDQEEAVRRASLETELAHLTEQRDLLAAEVARLKNITSNGLQNVRERMGGLTRAIQRLRLPAVRGEGRLGRLGLLGSGERPSREERLGKLGMALLYLRSQHAR